MAFRQCNNYVTINDHGVVWPYKEAQFTHQLLFMYTVYILLSKVCTMGAIITIASSLAQTHHNGAHRIQINEVLGKLSCVHLLHVTIFTTTHHLLSMLY